MRSCNEEKQNASKNYGITKRKDLEDMRELTGGKRRSQWVRRPLGGASGPHMSGTRGDFSSGDF